MADVFGDEKIDCDVVDCNPGAPPGDSFQFPGDHREDGDDELITMSQARPSAPAKPPAVKIAAINETVEYG